MLLLLCGFGGVSTPVTNYDQYLVGTVRTTSTVTTVTGTEPTATSTLSSLTSTPPR